MGVVIIVALAIGFHGPINRQLHNWKVLPEPEKLTELYFTHPNSLPTTYTPGQRLPVNFTVHNLEYKTETYHYQISETTNAGSQTKILENGFFTLKQNRYHNTNVNISTLDRGNHAKLEVLLVNVHESINYLLDIKGA